MQVIFVSLMSMALFAVTVNSFVLPPRKLGGSCQPSVRGKNCEAGLVCKLNDDGATGYGGHGTSRPGASGICYPEAELGQSCGGGSVRFPPICKAGLTCVYPPKKEHMIQVGTCKKVAKEGEECGGGTEDAASCEDGFHCYVPTIYKHGHAMPPPPGRSGVCKKD